MGNVLCGEVTPHIDNSNEAQSMGLMPDVFTDKTFVEGLGKINLNIQYGFRLCRTVMRPADVATAPTISTSIPLEDALYTLILVDPDAPSRTKPAFRSFFHHVMIDIPGKRVEKGVTVTTVAGGRTALEYIGPAPPYNSGPHRYMHMLFKQSGFLGNVIMGASTVKAFLKEGPGKLNVEEFVTKFELQLVAAHVFQASWDESCDAAHEQMGFDPPDQFKSQAQVAAAKEAEEEAAKKAAAEEAARQEAEEQKAAAAAANQQYISGMQKRFAQAFSFSTESAALEADTAENGTK